MSYFLIKRAIFLKKPGIRIAILVAAFSFCLSALGQSWSANSIDSLTDAMDKDSSLIPFVVSLDTTYLENELPMKVVVNFIVYVDTATYHVHKVVWNTGGKYYRFVTIYYNKGFGIKGLIKGKFQQTDINPEWETNSVVYYHSDTTVKLIELRKQVYPQSRYITNGFWYLSTVNDFIRLARLKPH